MNIVHVNLCVDYVGVSWLLHKALLLNGVNSRHILATPYSIHKVQQGFDIIASKDLPIATKVIQEADVLHVNGTVEDVCETGLNLSNIAANKPILFHNHGGPSLLDMNKLLKSLIPFGKNVVAVCSPLTKYIYKQALWLPNLVPINDPLYSPSERCFDNELMICHKIFSSAVRKYKGTDVLEECFNDFLSKDRNICFKTFEDLSISKTLEGSSSFHACIDNITQGFIGMSGWESLAKGQVVLSRLDPIVQSDYESLGASCPIINVSGMDELCNEVITLYEDKNKLKSLCRYSREWMEQNYNEAKILELYMKTYKELI